MIWNYLIALPLAGLAIFFALILWNSLKTGESRSRGVVISRADRPFQYWLGIILCAGVAFVPTIAVLSPLVGPLIGLQVQR